MDPLVLGCWILAGVNCAIVAGYFLYAKVIEPWLDVRKYGPRMTEYVGKHRGGDDYKAVFADDQFLMHGEYYKGVHRKYTW